MRSCPKWCSTTASEPVAGSVVIFTREETDGTFGDLQWRIGVVEETIKSTDGVCWQVRIRYRNAGERTFRTTKRAIRRMALLYSEAELCLVDELNEASKATNVAYLRAHPDKSVTSRAEVTSHPTVNCRCMW